MSASKTTPTEFNSKQILNAHNHPRLIKKPMEYKTYRMNAVKGGSVEMRTEMEMNHARNASNTTRICCNLILGYNTVTILSNSSVNYI